MMTLVCFLLLPAFMGGDAEPFLEKGDTLWVGRGMAEGYRLTFLKPLTVKSVRVLFMKEARVRFHEIPGRRFYLRTDFGDDYAFRTNPRDTYPFTPDQWSAIQAGRIRLGMSKSMFLCIMPKSEEIHVQRDAEGPVEQWIYRKEPVQLFGAGQQNPPVAVYFFRNEVLVSKL
ncbi:hypothetical protein SCOR_03030 [Sulfidibacter corallicola]|uniref:Uncharacterized protein n=1 Tax=Sulfidibacter corallicola TaxID=2818388 RepID=A0A8A4TG40_SULCO|nr:hypothetical protein [Sulfidibacter corallicola]QTD48497.1 hypothetical protein J3U87_23200 [Sulfidibacter corallicola]